ncbi:hypothetical protein D9619_009051 [Psilocybe cf. subviscida]|uniref:DUF4470 domain-containing protein n=1 Tax=Psilocybe cf. subviscida TaxID=2480587 RepID=A0A8H5BUT5_9AGAR|nr:hypothetical protein D9619_009051 [Psilocybe cf. subviscida]
MSQVPVSSRPLLRNIAEEVNQNGSTCYSDHKFKDAITAFERAAKLDKKEPKYLSNLSAVLYEIGNYTDTIHRIADAWSCLKSRDSIGHSLLHNPLAIKLVTRFAKSRMNETRSKSSIERKSLHSEDKTKLDKLEYKVEREMEDFVGALRPSITDDPKVVEMRKVWNCWRAMRSDLGDPRMDERYESRVSANAERFRALPTFKSAPDPTLQSFTFSTDECRSLLNPLGETTFDHKLTLSNPKRCPQKISWSFLFGGSGDARHTFTTISHVAAEMKRGAKVESLHITMVDIHAATQARFIIVMALLQQILDNVGTDAGQKKEREIDLYSAVFFVYTSVAMPDTCCDLVIETADALVKQLPCKTHPLSKYIHFDEGSLVAVVDALAYWAKPLQKSTKRLMEIMHSLPPSMNALSDDTECSMRINNLIRAGRRPATALDSSDVEQVLFLRTKVLFPPRNHLGRYPALEELANTYENDPPTIYAKIGEELARTWKPNPTLFDQSFTEWDVPFLGPNKYKGYPQHMSNFYHVNFHKSLMTTTLNLAGQPSLYCGYTNGFETTTQFFTMVAQSLARLKGVLQIEVIVNDVLTGIPKAVAGDLGPWPASFPQKYTRMWLSNVPDYTHGLLSTAVYLVPFLEDRQIAVANNLAFFGWRSMDEFCYNYTLLSPSDLPRILGCVLVNPHKNVMYEDIALEKLPLPRPIETLASKKQLHDWLARLLLCILCTGTCQAPPHRIDMPSNLGAFFHVLAHLTRVGFPAHWIGDFAQCIVADNLVTDAVPFQGALPIPTSFAKKQTPAPRRVRLQAWQAEIEVITATTYLGLPFFITLPETYVPPDEIHVYKAHVRPVDLTRHPVYLAFGSSLPRLMAPFAKIVGLIFYKPQKGIDGDVIAAGISEILEGSGKMKDIKVQILLGQERVDIYKGTISWKMSRRWYETMKSDNWEMVAYRTDVHCAITFPATANVWEKFL